MVGGAASDSRWQLYRLLSDPFRLRLLALAAEEELAVGELAELLGESQPNVSRHAAPLRQAGLLLDRRQGTRTLMRLAEACAADPVITDALQAGRKLCVDDGSLLRVAEIVRERDARTREFFSRPAKNDEPPGLASELPAYLVALSALIAQRELAIDAGTGDGVLLDVLAPVFRRVVALDRSEAQLGRALRRVRARGYDNVELVCGEVDDLEVKRALADQADVVVAARMLHHSPLPRATLNALSGLIRPGGTLIIIDYARHDDERFREQQADVWMGFDATELESLGHASGLCEVSVVSLPKGFVQNGIDGHIGWQMLVARRPIFGEPRSRKSARKDPRV